ncbi:MAG TPA: GTPase domain-containing protein, partial [Candidatus Hodarchaeales archaeon]|nr:GTPase domain-containing protein [Candidatus Hodarchaeales archaeon]
MSQSAKKLIILGDGGVGKTTLVHALKMGSQSLSQEEVKKTSFMEIETIETAGQPNWLVYDLSGQQSSTHPLEVMADMVLKDADLVVLIFALNRFSSLNNLQSWFQKLKNYYMTRNTSMPDIILLGSKADLKIRIDEPLIARILENVPEIIDYIKISSVTGYGIENLKKRIHLYVSELSQSQIVSEYEKLLDEEAQHPEPLPTPAADPGTATIRQSLIVDSPILPAESTLATPSHRPERLARTDFLAPDGTMEMKKESKPKITGDQGAVSGQDAVASPQVELQNTKITPQVIITQPGVAETSGAAGTQTKNEFRKPPEPMVRPAQPSGAMPPAQVTRQTTKESLTEAKAGSSSTTGKAKPVAKPPS